MRIGKLLTTLILFLSLPLTAQQVPVEKKAHATTHYIEQETIADDSGCSATAIGPHALLTATHCELPTDKISIDGHDATAIAGRIRDEADHTIYLLKDDTFTDVADVRLNDTLEAGTNVFIWGNPQAWTDILRRGYIEGTFKGCTLYSLDIDHGDSGAAIFDKDANIIGVVSMMTKDTHSDKGLAAAASFPLAFTADDIAKAKAYGIR